MARQRWVWACAAVLALGTTAFADTVKFSSYGSGVGDGDAHFAGTLTYSYDSTDDEGTLTITIENRTARSVGGYLSGFVFNVDGNVDVDLDDAPNSEWDGIEYGKETKLNPYGKFEWGATTGSKISLLNVPRKAWPR